MDTIRIAIARLESPVDRLEALVERIRLGVAWVGSAVERRSGVVDGHRFTTARVGFAVEHPDASVDRIRSAIARIGAPVERPDADLVHHDVEMNRIRPEVVHRRLAVDRIESSAGQPDARTNGFENGLHKKRCAPVRQGISLLRVRRFLTLIRDLRLIDRAAMLDGGGRPDIGYGH